MGNFLAELKRRHVYRAGGAYAVVAFGLIEIVSNVTPMLDLPAWFGRALILVLIVGFPLTLLAAWIIEAKPAESVQAQSTSKLDFALMGALALIVGLLIYQQVAPPQKVAAGVASAEGVSIVVLPFLNLSRDPEQEFFSDGMTEEITSALAKVQSLRVVGRTSAFKFKGQNDDLRTIGKALSASHILEGSVRKEGNQIRVTAQLIRADDGTHIWTDNYDRELKSVFAIQDEISQAIAGALRVPLGLKAGETLVANRAIDPDNYQQYLRAKALYRARGDNIQPLTEAITLLEQVVGRDPNYAPAWALLAQVYGNAPGYDNVLAAGPAAEEGRVTDALNVKGAAAAQRAIDLDPRSADAYTGLALNQPRGSWLMSEDLYKRALTLDPLNPDTLHMYSILLASAGRLKEAVPMRQRLRQLDPSVSIFNSYTAQILMADGQSDAALAMASTLPAYGMLAQTSAALGRYKEAADILSKGPQGVYGPGVAEEAVRLLLLAPAGAARNDGPDLGRLSFVYAYTGAPERALDELDRTIGGFHMRAGPYIWALSPSYAAARKTPRFKDLMRKAGLATYWRARGWPDMCRPVGADDFECS